MRALTTAGAVARALQSAVGTAIHRAIGDVGGALPTTTGDPRPLHTAGNGARALTTVVLRHRLPVDTHHHQPTVSRLLRTGLWENAGRQARHRGHRGTEGRKAGRRVAVGVPTAHRLVHVEAA